MSFFSKKKIIMNTYTHLDINKILVFGDIHGEFKEFFYKIKNNCKNKGKNNLNDEKILNDDVLEKLSPYLENIPSHITNVFYGQDNSYQSHNMGKMRINDCVIIVAGDCGFGFSKEEYYHQIFNKYIPVLEQNNIYIYFVRGNHDDPVYFEEGKINFERIKTIPDYSIIQLANKNILCVGGATSIDRVWRKQREEVINKYKTHKKKLYWEKELPFYSEEKLKEINDNGIKIDTVITHTSPHFIFPTQKLGINAWARVDSNIYKDIEKERSTLTQIYEFLKKNEHPLKVWCYGHFHMENFDTYEKVDFHAITSMNYIDISNIQTKEENDDWGWAIDMINPSQEEREIPRRQDRFVVDLADILFVEPNQENAEEQNEQPQPLHIGERLAAQLEHLRVNINRDEINHINERFEENVHNEIDTLINDELF